MYLDINVHLKELLDYLLTLSSHLRLRLDPDQKVFKSEPQLYGDDNTLIRNLHQSGSAYTSMMTLMNSIPSLLFRERYCQYMAEKLRLYKADQLPGGKSWSPSDAIKKALAPVEPTNDLCEGILGLNDWRQKVTPNCSQRSCTSQRS